MTATPVPRVNVSEPQAGWADHAAVCRIGYLDSSCYRPLTHHQTSLDTDEPSLFRQVALHFRNCIRPNFYHTGEQFSPHSVQMHIIPFTSPACVPSRLVGRTHGPRAIVWRVHARGSASNNVHASSVYEETLRKEASEQAPRTIPEKELSRREKISRANKGKVPWNKGKHMSEEMKAKISQRTYEAMQRPDVRERMKKANANRAPHSDEVRKRIREVLRKRANEAKVVIREQTRMIVEALAESEDEVERDIAARRDAAEVIGKLAWRVLHRDFELMYGKWEADVDGFRQEVKIRFQNLNEREANSRSGGSRKKHPGVVSKAGEEPGGSSGGSDSSETVSSSTLLLSQAEEKLASVSAALTKLQGMKTTYKDDPESLKLVEDKEAQTTDMLERLQSQVELLKLSSTGESAGSVEVHNLKAGSALPWSTNPARATARE